VKPTLSFDASGINRLLDNRIACTPALAAIQSAFRIRLTATSVDELIADPDPVRRAQLLDVSQALLPHADVLHPFQEILRNQVFAFETDRAYDWSTVAVEAQEYRREIALREVLSDTLSEEQRIHAAQVAADFESIYAEARPHFLAIFDRHPQRERPSVEEILEVFRQPGGSFWETVARLYERACGHRPELDVARTLIDRCPPFRSILTAMVLAQHDRVIAEKTAAQRSKLAGRVDVFSATFLPYCEIFVSDDRDQQRFLRKVVELTGASTEVVWFNAFLDRIGVGSECLAAKA
jgi:hypothetical protein